MANLKERIKAEALRLGFSFCGIAEPRQTPHFGDYLNWIGEKQNAGMEYLARDYVINGRRKPATLLEGAKSVIVAGIHYLPQINFEELKPKKGDPYGFIASYACLPDYHVSIKRLFQELVGSIHEMTGKEIKSKIFIDSGPVMEKDFAAQAGLGWIGRNSLLIHPQFGSYCLLGCLFTDLDLPPDLPIEGDICEDCQVCIKACPTGCIYPNRTIKAGMCISYQTIETKDDFPEDLKNPINSWVFGCDICQIVCPINRRIVEASLEKNTSATLPKLSQKINLQEARAISQDEFEKIFSDLPLNRISLKTFQRNIENGIANKKEQ